MKTRSAWLSAVVAMAAAVPVALPALAADEDLPCPTAQMIQQARDKNQAKGKLKSEEFYQELRQNYDQQCAMAKQELVALKPKLKEHEDGKRNDRDGYIILRKLAWQYQVLRAENHPEAQAIAARMKALDKKNAKLRDIQDDKLSEDLALERKRAEVAATNRTAAQQWIPPDADPISEYSNGSTRIVAYQYRIEFFNAAGNVATKILKFKHRVFTAPDPENWVQDSGGNILVCTREDAGYSPRSETEASMIRRRGHARAMPWINTAANMGPFCGIVAPTGHVLFEFPPMSFPVRVYVPLGMVSGGRRAAVKVGSFVRNKPVEGDDDSHIDTVSDFKQVLVWDFPDHLRTVPISKDDLWGNRLIKRLRDGGL